VTLEQTRLKRYELRVEWPLAAVALVFLVLLSADVLARPHGMADTVIESTMKAIWALFILDYLVRLYLAEPRLHWFVRHLFDLAIIALPALRPLRLLSLAMVIKTMQRAIGHTIRGKVIVYTSFGAIIIVYGGALAMLEAERDHNEKINNMGDALWWAFTTVTTVGYGDTFPVTVLGRFVAVALMVAGVSVLGVVTATLASWIVQRVAEEDDAAEAVTAAHIDELRAEIRHLTATVSGLRSGEPPPADGEPDDGAGAGVKRT
jgi:voltage-gated potassium channel